MMPAEGRPSWIDAERFHAIPQGVPGSYVLIFRLAESAVISAGKLPPRAYAAGWYAYAGSALNGLKRRLVRYLNPQRKRRWHIDYVLDHAVIEGAAAFLAARMETVAGFGSSDCRCLGHLFHLRSRYPACGGRS